MLLTMGQRTWQVREEGCLNRLWKRHNSHSLNLAASNAKIALDTTFEISKLIKYSPNLSSYNFHSVSVQCTSSQTLPLP